MLLRLLSTIFRSSGDSRAAADESVAACLERGLAIEKQGRLAEALACYRSCAERFPHEPQPRLAIANALSALWRIDECIAAFSDAMTLVPHADAPRSEYLMFLHFATHPDARRLLEAHREYGEIAARDVAARESFEPGNAPDPERRLRIGYVSGNLYRHSVGYFIEPVIAHHDRTRYESYCYHTQAWSDDTTERIARAAHAWRQVAGDDDDTLARRIRDDRIDVLVDLSGHTRANRLRVFARRAAPVQMTWLGYPDTTGVAAVDYRITDAIADPSPAGDALHTERLLRLPTPFLTYQPPADGPAVAPRDAGNEVVFACFNLLIKVNERSIGVWARILEGVPGSRIVLKSAMLGNEEAARRVRDAFAARGIDPRRVELKTWAPDRAAHLAAYNDVDIALDSFPYNGTTTTCEALWMGVPVVTLTGEMHMSRVGAVLLGAAGLADLVASDEDAYVRTAVGLARDANRRRDLRAGLRDRLATSRLLDHAGFTRNFEEALRQAWREWCTKACGRSH